MATTVKYPRRVHIAAVGYEIDRVVEPVIEMEADKVWLLTERRPEYDQGKPYLKSVEAAIHRKNKKCEIKIKKCDFEDRDLFDVLRAYRDIIQEEENNQIFVNVSTGTKIHSIAGMMACMIFKNIALGLKPYYAKPEGYTASPKEGAQLSYGCCDIFELPSYKIERPSEYLISVLKAFSDYSISRPNPIAKKELIDLLTKQGLLSLSNERKIKNENIARYLALKRRCLDPLIAWEFIELSGSGTRCRIRITEEGKNILKFLE